MKHVKTTIVVIGAALIMIQFIRPDKNISTAANDQSIGHFFPLPDSVDRILQPACYDCHSNNTRYPWYASIEPVGWYLNDHITDGKRELNFDEFGSYSPRRQFGKLREIQEQINRDDMPLPSYRWIHWDAVLSPDQKTSLLSWSESLMDSLNAHYPPDSLSRRRRRTDNEQKGAQ